MKKHIILWLISLTAGCFVVLPLYWQGEAYIRDYKLHNSPVEALGGAIVLGGAIFTIAAILWRFLDWIIPSERRSTTVLVPQPVPEREIEPLPAHAPPIPKERSSEAQKAQK